MRSLTILVAGLVLALGVAPVTLAAGPSGTSPSAAIPFTTTASGSVTGSTWPEAFAYHTFYYPGDGSQGMITMTFSPGDLTTANAVGIGLWQEGRLLATMSGHGGAPGTNSVTFSSAAAGPVLVQVYNYYPGATVAFELALSGVKAVPPPMAAAAVLIPMATPVGGSGTASSPYVLPGSADEGILPGNDDGSYVYYTFPYPGDGSTQTITLGFNPIGHDVGDAVFLMLYQDGNLLAGGNGAESSTLGEIKLGFSSSTAGPVLIQVANYNRWRTISYTIGR